MEEPFGRKVEEKDVFLALVPRMNWRIQALTGYGPLDLERK